ncbi:phosphate acyltransferase PlsX [Frigidibacter sp. MR17.24]|uniref:phosphate acyltransferase PlsX n=1 Tax=Frigidibacter sp. MR17.24 TaxID=3127345 RepID=UPI003012AE72
MQDLNAETAPGPGPKPAPGRIVISVDAMGGDRGAEAVAEGIRLSAVANPEIGFIVHGPEPELSRLLDRPELTGRVEIRHAEGVVKMTDKPSQVMRSGAGTSMWSAIESVKQGEAVAAVSCGNTGALMALSMIRLRKLPGVNRPAIACLWPSRNPSGFNVMLDVGADIRADAEDLLQYALMGASYARNGLGLQRPRVGLLNVGTEEHKGRAELKQAQDMIQAATEIGGFDYTGFVEGGDLPGARCDVIVTDGFTGNIALKTGEGTAKLVSDFLKEAFGATFLSKIAALLALASLKRLQRRIDPRRVNGGVFLGLNGTIVKSHGSADALGVSAAIKLAFQLAKSGFQQRLAQRLAQVSQNQAEALAATAPATAPATSPGAAAGAPQGQPPRPAAGNERNL